MPMPDAIIYDQPLNEMIRVCLRLEQLFQQIDHELPEEASILSTRNLMSHIINILLILDRPDLRAKLAKELSHFAVSLSRFQRAPEIDEAKLNQLTTQLENYSRSLINNSGKIGQRLREVELLNTLRMHLASPGGGCSFDLPIYHYWLQQPTTERQAIIQDWLSDFSEIRAIAELVLEIVRQNGKAEQKTAIHGFHQELLDPQSNLRMIRIGIANNIPAFPEISISRHFFSVRFISPDINKRPQQYTENLPFTVIYCNA